MNGVDHNQAATIRKRAESEPSAVDIADVVAILVHGARDERDLAIEAYDTVVRDRPDAVEKADAALETLLADESADVRCRAAKTATALLERDPDGYAAIIPPLRSLAGNPAESAREPAILALVTLALERPDRAAPASDALLSMARARLAGSEDSTTGPNRTRDPTVPDNPERERRDQIRVRAMAGLTRIAAEQPAAVRDDVAAFAALLEDDHYHVRTGACEVLDSLAAAVPDDVEPHAPALATRIDVDTKHPVPRRAADALETLADAAPERAGEAVAPIAPALEPLLAARKPAVRRTALELLVVATRQEPTAADDLVPTLRELHATDPDEEVRGLAGRVLEAVDGNDAAEDDV